MDILVRESNHPIALLHQPRRSIGVPGLRRSSRMTIAVNLNNQLRRLTTKVNNVSPYWMLAPELETGNLPISQRLP